MDAPRSCSPSSPPDPAVSWDASNDRPGSKASVSSWRFHPWNWTGILLKQEEKAGGYYSDDRCVSEFDQTNCQGSVATEYTIDVFGIFELNLFPRRNKAKSFSQRRPRRFALQRIEYTQFFLKKNRPSNSYADEHKRGYLNYQVVQCEHGRISIRLHNFVLYELKPFCPKPAEVHNPHWKKRKWEKQTTLSPR